MKEEGGGKRREIAKEEGEGKRSRDEGGRRKQEEEGRKEKERRRRKKKERKREEEGKKREEGGRRGVVKGMKGICFLLPEVDICEEAFPDYAEKEDEKAEIWLESYKVELRKREAFLKRSLTLGFKKVKKKKRNKKLKNLKSIVFSSSIFLKKFIYE